MALIGTTTTPESERDFWQTPPDLFRFLDWLYGPFDLDAAANKANACCPRWLGPGGLAEDALRVQWGDYGRLAFCNPPYSRFRLPAFVAHAARQHQEGLDTACLVLPATTEVQWFHRYVWDRALRRPRPGVLVDFLPRRVRFLRPDGTPGNDPTGATMVVIFRAA